MPSQEFLRGFDGLGGLQAEFPRYNVREIGEVLLGVRARVEVTEDQIARELDDLGEISELANSGDYYLDVTDIEEQWKEADRIVALLKWKEQLVSYIN